MKNNMIKILTNHPGQSHSETWEKYTYYIPVEGNSIFASIKNAIKMQVKARYYDCIILGAGRADIFYLIFNLLNIKNRKKCIVIDCLWYESNNKIYHSFKRFIFKIADLSVDRYVVWATREILAYSRAFPIKKNKFIFIPYHHTINNLNIKVKDGGYLFSGGNFGRDYKTLIEAVTGLNVKLLIASSRPEIFEGIQIPDNVVIAGFSHEEYLEKMAGCLINIVALAPNLLHSGGQQTFLNSMYLGKPTIVLDLEGASDYITDGFDGIIIEPGNHEKLKIAIIDLLNNPSKARAIGENGRERAHMHSTEEHFKKIVNIAFELLK